jgi:hypothetical protein
MALLFECMPKCCRKGLNTADIVRDAWLQQQSLREALTTFRHSDTIRHSSWARSGWCLMQTRRRTILACTLLLLSCLDVLCRGQNSTVQYRVMVTGQLPSESVTGMEFLVDGHQAGVCPRIIVRSSDPRKTICSFFTSTGRHSLVVNVWGSGYKRSSLKLPDFTVKETSACTQAHCPSGEVVDIGSVTLEPGDLTDNRR